MTPKTRLLIGGLSACAVALGLGRFAFTPILPLMQAAHGLDTQSAGWLAASNNLGYLAGAVWAGLIATDRGRHLAFTASLVVVAASLAAMSLTSAEWVWNLIRLVAGIASALVFVLGAALVVPALAGLGAARLTGVHFSGVGLGIILSGSVIAWAGGWGGDNAAWLAAGALCCVLSAASAWGLRHVHGSGAAGTSHPAPAPFSLGWLSAAYFCAGLAYIVTGTFLVVVVRATPGLESIANLSWVVVGLAAMPSSAAWALFAARFGFRLALIFAHLLMAAGAGLLAVTDSAIGAMVSALLYGGTFLGIAGMAMAFGRAIAPEHPARAMGMLTAAFSVGQMIGPVAAAFLADWGGWMPALLMAALVTLAGVPMLMAGRISPSSGRS
ncbi:MAG: YbfB/YjiJ family MFS transporter [Alphaproteobacteria bacterium]|nr:YbfB/YjiJ family MFS transporter [Alphaproteobacteria bacterium]